MKAFVCYLSVLLFIMLYKLVVTFQSLDKILKCGHSSPSCYIVSTTCAVERGSNKESMNFVT